MELNQEQLGAVLQACLDQASAMLLYEGGFLPFGARARTDDMEFIQLAPEEGEGVESVYNRLIQKLAGEARAGEIIGSAVVADGRVGEGDDDRAIIVLVETAGFARSILAPYKNDGKAVEFGQLSPQASPPAVFAR